MPTRTIPRTTLLLALGALLCLPAAQANRRTPLDDYIARPDTNYKYELKTKAPGKGVTFYLLELTSQAWRTEAEVDRPVWKHWLGIYKPETVTSSIGLLSIGGGVNDGKPPRTEQRLVTTAEVTGTVVAELRMVPNQPLRFAGDSYGPRTEDEMIAYTWDRYLKTGDPTWPARLPMTKSAVRAMDAVTEFLKRDAGVKVDRFVVAGGSKRGWTSWTTAAVDKRVVAVAPIVIDLLNVEKSFQHHFRVYGFWAPAIKDYFNMGLMDHMGDPKFHELMKIVEPYEYRDRLTMPKFVMNSAGDQFFLPDSWRFYFNDLPGEKYLRYVPNSDHSLRNTDAWDSLIAFYHAVLNGRPRPRFTWKLENNGSIRVATQDQPAAVKLWQATNPNHRDFRLESVGPIYTETDLAPVKEGVYEATVPKPAEGWTAFFVELTYPSPTKYPFKFTTGVRVVPDTLPYPPPEKGKTRIGPKKQ